MKVNRWFVLAGLAAMGGLAPLPGCRGCEGVQIEFADTTQSKTAPRDATPSAPAVVALEKELGVKLAPRSASPLFARMPDAPVQPLAPAALQRRLWLAWGPSGLIASGRTLLPGGTLSVDAATTALRHALVDWQERAGVPVRGALLAVDARADAASARALYTAARNVVPGPLAAIVLDGTQGAEVSLPSGPP